MTGASVKLAPWSQSDARLQLAASKNQRFYKLTEPRRKKKGRLRNGPGTKRAIQRLRPRLCYPTLRPVRFFRMDPPCIFVWGLCAIRDFQAKRVLGIACVAWDVLGFGQ